MNEERMSEGLTDEVVIRRMAERDLDAVADIEARTFARPWTRENIDCANLFKKKCANKAYHTSHCELHTG